MESIRNSQSGKMLEELLVQTMGKTSDVCWKDLENKDGSFYCKTA